MPAATALLVRAAALLKAGRPADAIGPLGEAVVLDPNNAQLQHDLGLACLEAGRLADSVAAFEGAIAARPRYAGAWFRMGIALERMGRADAALRAYDRATALQPGMVEAWFHAGALAYTMGHRKEAAGCFRRAASAGPKTGLGRLGAARALLAEDRDREAEPALRRVLALDPDNAMAQDLLGNLLADAGRFEAAAACFEAAIARAPLMAGSAYDLFRCRPAAAADSGLIAALARAVALPGLDAAQLLRVHLALGKAADDGGDPEQAMTHWDAADRVRGALHPFDAGAFERDVEALIGRFPGNATQDGRCDSGGARQDAVAAAAEPGGPAPVVIVGLPRSGTTLVEQILSSHPAVAGGGELPFWTGRGAAWRQAGAAGMQAPFLAQAAADYRAVLGAAGAGAARVTDKMPFNFLWAGLIHRACPDATIIHCRRAAIDTALSIHQTHFNPRLPFPTGGQALVAYVRTTERLMGHWRAVLPPDRFVEIEYESLTAAPEQEIRRLVAACGLAWDDACLHPERNARVVKTASRWQARQPIHRNAVQRWRRYAPWLGPLQALVEAADASADAR